MIFGAPNSYVVARHGRYNTCMYHYDPNIALEELTEDATLPNPVHVRDMILRKKLTADKSLELNRLFVEYQKFFGEAQKLGKEILKRLAGEIAPSTGYQVPRGAWVASRGKGSIDQPESRAIPRGVNPASLNNDIRVPFGTS